MKEATLLSKAETTENTLYIYTHYIYIYIYYTYIHYIYIYTLYITYKRKGNILALIENLIVWHHALVSVSMYTFIIHKKPHLVYTY